MITINSRVVNFTSIPDIVHNVVLDISKRVAGLTLVSISPGDIHMDFVQSLFITTQGDYCMTIILTADIELLQTIVRNMKRSALVHDSDISTYIPEFFNILCGRIVSSINALYHCNAQFHIPQMINGSYLPEARDLKFSQEYFYKDVAGAIKIAVLFK